MRTLLCGQKVVKLNQYRSGGWRRLMCVGHRGHAEVVSMLLDKQGDNVNQAMNDGATPLYIASYKGHA